MEQLPQNVIFRYVFGGPARGQGLLDVEIDFEADDFVLKRQGNRSRSRTSLATSSHCTVLTNH
jgi:hypothetical protein